MTYTARLKVSCDNKNLLSRLSYTLLNTTTQKSYGGKIDQNGCTKIYNCNKLDLIFVELILNNSKIARVRIPALENGEFNKSIYKLKSTTGTTKPEESNKVLVKVKNELEIALEALHGTALYFSNNFLDHDSALRNAYMKAIKKMSHEYLKDVENGKMTVKEAAKEAHALRNDILDQTRKKNSPIALAASQKEKRTAKNLDQFLEYYALKLKDPDKWKKLKYQSRQALDDYVKTSNGTRHSYFQSLSTADKNKVFYSVVKGSGSSHGTFDKAAKYMKPLGRVIIVISISYAWYEIFSAENKEKEFYKQAATIGSGVAAGAAGGAIVGGVCGPGSPICSTVGVIIGGIAGGYGAYKLVEAYDEELEAFTEWTLF